jgi:predicted nucleic acid-binding protein
MQKSWPLPPSMTVHRPTAALEIASLAPRQNLRVADAAYLAPRTDLPLATCAASLARGAAQARVALFKS